MEALESLRRHGFHGSRAASVLGPGRRVVRWPIELIARPPRDRSRTFAGIAITLMVGVWIVLPTLVAIAIAT